MSKKNKADKHKQQQKSTDADQSKNKKNEIVESSVTILFTLMLIRYKNPD